MEISLYSKSTEINLNTPKKYAQIKRWIYSKKFNLTIASLIKLIPPKTGRDEYHDTKVPELTLRVTSS
ncbi:MAG: hypothetical protein HRT53_02345 [Colwellia sp.]|nr:hypothetical protein [Colwellia sp.]